MSARPTMAPGSTSWGDVTLGEYAALNLLAAGAHAAARAMTETDAEWHADGRVIFPAAPRVFDRVELRPYVRRRDEIGGDAYAARVLAREVISRYGVLMVTAAARRVTGGAR